MVLILATCAALGTLAAAGEDVQVVCEWDFARGMQEWVANSTAQVKQDKGGIVIETDGRGPQLTSPKLDIEPRAGDVLEAGGRACTVATPASVRLVGPGDELPRDPVLPGQPPARRGLARPPTTSCVTTHSQFGLHALSSVK